MNQQNFVKIGPKQKHLNIPDSWTLVTSGPCVSGDMCADISNQNKPKWMLCTEEHEIGDDYSTFEALIRKTK